MLQCPICRNRGEFSIRAIQHITLIVRQWPEASEAHTTGTMQIHATIEEGKPVWTDADRCKCLGCAYQEALRTFQQPDTLEYKT